MVLEQSNKRHPRSHFSLLHAVIRRGHTSASSPSPRRKIIQSRPNQPPSGSSSLATHAQGVTASHGTAGH
ncbi:hypothetical protein VFPFJ_05455 [Purpureocillium lilacinum]|uniref:Uncharacterized protein n=1 Tax=Purpureocillium lilacinum TaxID=33203 RepID=A0A179H4S6_PURLI|nr:hypothetical protein VFPFJ_05455 [Purpureocillium lilacinum]OAQ84511.1 hypothetical protein VFPBJ_03279 [Purpureocillium lilacinum]OAQ91296.1 hypothetical protein VFPFJ_05455 [Purpureocillium lilacinum]